MAVRHDKEVIKQSTCAYCGVGCGVDINVFADKAISLQGSENHPANFGRLCVKGTNLLATSDLENRLLVPQINGEQVQWETAIKEVADKFNHLINTHGKDAVAFYVSGQLLTEDYYVANKLMKGYIGAANIDTNSRLCMSSAVAAYKRAFGEDVVPCNYSDLEQTDLLVITGSNLAWTHPVLYQRIERAKKINPNYKVVVIDPRKTVTAQSADYFLQIKPGTDAAFFNGLVNYLYDNNGLDRDYIERHTEGFENVLTESRQWPIDKVAQFCQVSSCLLTKVYKLFCQSKKAVTFYSMGINQSSSGVDKCHSIINCHLASGKIAKSGCGPFSITGQPNAMGGREVGGLSNQLTAHMDISRDDHRDKVKRFWQSPTMATESGAMAVDLFEQIEQGKIKAVWIMATNPMVSLPNRVKVAKALEKCEFVVVSDCVATNDTLAFADVKLPATPWLEKNGTVTNSERRISRQRNAISPQGQAKHDWQIVCDVAKAMGFSGFDYESVDQVFTEFAALSGFENDSERLFDISGLAKLSSRQYDQLQPVQWPINKKYPDGCQRVYGKGQFSRPSGKAKFFAVTPKLPVQRVERKYPFVLNSGRLRDQWHTMTRTGKAATLSQNIDKPQLTINPIDAQSLNLKENQLVRVFNDIGNVTVYTHINEQQRLGECFMPIHWNRQFASSANVSNVYDNVVDPISGQPETKHAAVNIEPARFEQFGHILVAGGISLSDISIDTEIWVKSQKVDCVAINFASNIIANDALNWLQQQTGLIGEWLQYSDQQSCYYLCLQQGKLACLAAISNNFIEFEPSWYNYLFAQHKLTLEDIQSALSGSPSEQFKQGKQICSCHNVGEKSIVSAIENGAHTVEELGKSLKCGTQCGSCKPELSQLLNEHSYVLSFEENNKSQVVA